MGRMSKRIAAETGDRPGAPEAPQQGAPGRQPMDDAAAAARARIQNAQARAQRLQTPPAGAPQTAAPGAVGRPRRAERAAREGMATREPFGSHEQQLKVPDIPGFAKRWFNDTPGRIERAMRAGWVHVADEVRGGDVSRNVGRGEGQQRGLTAYLMKTPLEFYNEDQEVQQAELEERLGDIRNGQGQGEKQYVGAHHRVVQGTRG